VVTKQAPSAELTPVLDFAFTVVRRLTSNAIAVCQGASLVGAGIGQTSRVDATRIALEKAGSRARGGVLASDAFFPFADSIPLIARAGIIGSFTTLSFETNVLHSGSAKVSEVLEAVFGKRDESLPYRAVRTALGALRDGQMVSPLSLAALGIEAPPAPVAAESELADVAAGGP
jgi:hypothetical protein